MHYWAIVYAIISSLAGIVATVAYFTEHADIGFVALFLWFLFGGLGVICLLFMSPPGPPR